MCTQDELYAVMKAMGGDPSAEELQGVMYELDADGNQVSTGGLQPAG
jgi:Ca2+-binding EF-hand superfamily protein